MDDRQKKLKDFLDRFIKAEKILATAESCTGGLLAAAITEVPGVSAAFDRGFITYSNEAKTEMLGVPKELIGQYGAVSPEVAKAMAEGAIKNSNATVAISITGIAGPTGGSEDKPVGLVYIGSCIKGEDSNVHKFNFSGDRKSIRSQTVDKSIDLFIGCLKDCI